MLDDYTSVLRGKGFRRPRGCGRGSHG